MSAAVVVGAKSDRPGRYFIRSFVVDYVIGSHHYRSTFDQGLKVCVGAHAAPADGPRRRRTQPFN